MNEIKKVHGIFIFRRITGYHYTSLTARIFDFKELNSFVFYLAPSIFRPKSDAQIGADHIFYCGRRVAFKNDFRHNSRLMAIFIADITKLLRAHKTDKVLLRNALQVYRRYGAVFFVVRHSKKNTLGTFKAGGGICWYIIHFCRYFNIANANDLRLLFFMKNIQKNIYISL